MKKMFDGVHMKKPTKKEFVKELLAEMHFGLNKFGEYHSMHEAYAVIKEELDEFWDGVKENDPDPKELLQLAATAFRGYIELCNTATREVREVLFIERFSEEKK